MQRVLLIEDSEECQLMVTRSLASPDIIVEIANNLKSACTFLASNKNCPIQLILLDLSLPDGDGFSILDSLKNDLALKDIPVFLMTKNDELLTKVAAFGLGVDDYLVKPIHPIEFRARVEMRLKKLAANSSFTDVIRRGDIVLYPTLLKACNGKQKSDKHFELTKKEFKILEILIENENRICTRDQIVNCVWGHGTEVAHRTVDSHICSLRKKMDTLAHYIGSIPSLGYFFSIDNGSKPKFPDQLQLTT